MGNVLHFQQPTLAKSTFDLEFQDEKLFFDVGFQDHKVIIYWYRELESEESEPKQEIVYEREVRLNKVDLFISKIIGRAPHLALKKKTLSSIRKAINEFRKKVILQDNMTDLVTEIMDAGQTNIS